ncbi:MAG: tetratricopeptide repeat protein, partial [Candidatus Omnitrophica bacterium]|nr:tetratricopeptide repeat protein [Candidatus Omnitrophota bacterium]
MPALKNGFVDWDDNFNLIGNLKYRGLGLEQLKWMFTTGYTGPYQPLSWVTFGIDYLIWRMNPFGYHLTNLVLHSINALIFYFLCVRLLTYIRPPFPEKETEIYLSAGFAALFFAIHPLRVESVAWATERRDVLCGLFYLLTLLWYIKPRAARGELSTTWRRHVLPLATFLLALLSKGMAVSLPIVLVILDIYPLQRLSRNPGKWFSMETRQIWLEKIPFFILAAVFGAIGYAFQTKAGALGHYQKFSFAPQITQILCATVFYIQKTLLPFNLSPFYRLPNGFGLLNWPAMSAGAIIAVLTSAAFAIRRRWPAGLAVWVYYLVTLSPVVGVVKLGFQFAADRYTYIPCLVFSVLFGTCFLICRQAVAGRFRNICAIIACLIITGLAGLTWHQEGIWRDSETLWRHVLTANPEVDVAHCNLANILFAQGKTEEAAEHYHEALRINPDSEFAHYNLGVIMAAQGKTDAAVWHYCEALRINPGV